MPIRHAPWTGALVAAGLLAGCSGQTLSQGGEAACEAGQRQCVGLTVQQCGADGTFQTTAACGADQQCDDTLGCIDCSPGTMLCTSGNTEVHTCTAAGTVGPLTQTCGFGQACSGGVCVDACEVAASQFIYLVDAQNNFLSFQPAKDGDPASLKLVGKLACSTTSTPYAMAVDRKARAWVLYQDGNMYLVNPQDASCTPSGFVPGQMGFSTFGMGFVSDGVGASTESLYGGSGPLNGNLGLARIAPGNLTLTKVAPFPMIDYAVEFTGTGAAELYGYFPSATTGKNFIARIDKTTAQYQVVWQLAPLPGMPSAWAFAHWGGRYYQFVSSAGKNQIFRYDPATQKNVIVQDSTPYPIVGAGVSTCAPYIVG